MATTATPISVTSTPPPPPPTLTLSATPASAQAGGAQIQVTATLLDGLGNPMPGHQVQFLASGSAHFLFSLVTVDAQGHAVAQLSDMVAESVQVIATAN